MRTVWVWGILAYLFSPAVMRAGIEYDASVHTWKLKSGSIELRLGAENGAVSFLYLGPADRPSWPAPKERLHPFVRSDIGGLVSGQFLIPEEFALVSNQIRNPAPDVSELVLRFQAPASGARN
jgi:hypothetical protein